MAKKKFISNTTKWFLCDSCENLHLEFIDENGIEVSATLSEEMLVDMLSTIRGEGPSAKFLVTEGNC